MNKNNALNREIKEELDQLGKKIKNDNIKDKEILDAYKRVRELLN